MTTILIIEDSAPLRNNIVEMLELEGFQTLTAGDGAAGVEIARAQRPDLILCDIMMPVMDGYQVLELLHEDPATATIPFIFLTARSDRLDIRQGMSQGADDFLTKPFTVRDLLNSVNARLVKREEQERATVEKLDRLRENIILALPHELRTPLNVIIGFSDLLRNDASEMDAAQTRDMAQHIYQAAHRLYHLIENYITYAQLEMVRHDAGMRENFRSGYLLYPDHSIPYWAREQMASRGREQDLVLALETAECIAISEESLRKIVMELLDNACKFSQPGTHITVRSETGPKHYLISVEDKGRGMTEEQIAQVGAYNQFDRPLYEDQGSGLGLVICKRLAELAGGSLSIQSERGAGTVVIVQIPVRAYPE